MTRLFRKLTSGFFLGANFLVILLFLFSCITPYLHPGNWWFTGFMGLLFPYLLALLLFFLVFWLIVHPRKSLFSLVALLLGMGNIRTLIAFGGNDDFPGQPPPGNLRVMNWNVRYFVPFRKNKFEGDETDNMTAILGEIKTYSPDVICFQEFYNNGEEKGKDMIKLMTRDMGYPYHYFSRDQVHWNTIITGTAIFSRYPILQATKVPYPPSIEEGAESTLFADIAIGGDTIRFGNIHLQSFRFMPRDYQSFTKMNRTSGWKSPKKFCGK
jgi:hypothetical protein